MDKMNKTPIRLVGFSKRKNKEVTVLLYEHTERTNIADMYYFFEPDTMIQCREFNSGVLLEELELRDLFNPIK